MLSTVASTYDSSPLMGCFLIAVGLRPDDTALQQQRERDMANAVQAVQVAQAASEGWWGVPWIIWSGLISAAVASGVAAFTMKASSKNSLRLLATQHTRDDAEAERQRKHDAKQKDEDRKGAIRMEVYVKAIEATHALLGFIGGLPERPLGEDDSEGFQIFLKANANIWLVADAEAAHMSRDLAGDFAEVYFHQLKTSYPLRQALEPVRQRKDEIDFAKGEVRRLGLQLTDARARRAPSDEQGNLNNLVVEKGEYVKALELSQQQALREIAPRRLEAFAATFGQIRGVQRALVKLVSALRAELNLARDDNEFMEQLKDMERRAWAAVNKVYGIDPPGPMPETVDKVHAV